MTDTLDPAATAYLPWARQGLAAQWAALGARSTEGRLALPLALTLEQTGAVTRSTAVAAPVLRLQGPPDVIEIKASQVIRTEPTAGMTPFEPNFLAAIEFVRPDLPWLFSPTPPDATQNRHTPWITLVVMPAAAATVVPAGEKALARLTCARSELPPLDQAWAWAHVQVTGGASGGAIKTLLADTPRALSRLVCPRQLQPDTAYIGCVVPTYELGRLAGLGIAIDAAKLTSTHLQWAWDGPADTTAVTLPVYFQWRFSTGAGGDFESLASRLTPRIVPAGAGTLAIDLSRPGWGVPVRIDGGTLPLQGALAVPEVDPPAWTQSNDLSTALTTLLNAPRTIADGLIGPPLYGQAYPRIDSLDATAIGRAPPAWFAELNLGVAHRIAAGLGALTVRIEQDAMMAAAWGQLVAFDRENQSARRQQLATEVGLAIDGRQGAVAAASLAPAALRLVSPPPIRARLALKGPHRGRAAPAGASLPAAHRARASALLVADPGARATTFAAPRTLADTAATASAPSTDLQRFRPRFATPAGELLKDFFPTFLFPGLGSLPADSVTALAPNPAFIESYLIGLNHEFGREMLWRGFPADPRGTAFRNFWPALPPAADLLALQKAVDAAQAAVAALLAAEPDPYIENSRGVQITNPAYRAWQARLTAQRAALDAATAALVTATEPPADIAPIDEWNDASVLGSHGSGGASLTVVVVKGALLQRYPHAAIYIQQARWDGTHRVLDLATRSPVFQIDHAPDVTLLAFDIGPDAFRGAATPPGDAGWFFVLQEQPDAHRFGLDAVPDHYTGAYGGMPKTWSNLSWTHVATSAEALAERRYLTLDALQPLSLPLVDSGSATATWARSSADIAAITRQRPFRYAVHGAQWFPTPSA